MSTSAVAVSPIILVERAGHSQEYRLWMPDLEPYDEEKYVAWAGSTMVTTGLRNRGLRLREETFTERNMKMPI
jgi:hypothetical protein